jgi:FtsP/CotA-like multicopper oxidase with cupredoxin domain
LLGGAAAAAGAALAGGIRRPAAALAPLAPPTSGRTVELSLVAAERQVALPAFSGRALPLWSFTDGATFPQVVRMRIGDTLVARLENRIAAGQEEMSVHWHGVRLPNNEDGVPYLTQPPVPQGGTHTYRFAPPDTGAFWFHTHCNTAESIGRGLLGILVVEGDETRPYDGDVVLCLKDWRIGEDGAFLPFETAEGASRAGTFGAVRTVNGAIEPEIALPAGGDVRLRLINVDPTRVPEIGVRGAEAAVVAVDGVGVPPFPLKSWRLGPAMRLDVVVRAPSPGGRAELVDYHAKAPVRLASFVGAGPMLARGAFDPAPLYATPLPVPDLAAAETIPFTFGATATGESIAAIAGEADAPILGPLCTTDQTFWAINKAAWPGRSHARLPPPLAVLKRGASYRFVLHNVTPHVHPVHMHGHTFRVLGSSSRSIVPHHADTVLLTPKERVEVAFVADNPGDWMMHCHILEHQETGMMGYFRVA